MNLARLQDERLIQKKAIIFSHTGKEPEIEILKNTFIVVSNKKYLDKCLTKCILDFCIKTTKCVWLRA